VLESLLRYGQIEVREFGAETWWFLQVFLDYPAGWFQGGNAHGFWGLYIEFATVPIIQRHPLLGLHGLESFHLHLLQKGGGESLNGDNGLGKVSMSS
jgi:hypothetical protein